MHISMAGVKYAWFGGVALFNLSSASQERITGIKTPSTEICVSQLEGVYLLVEGCQCVAIH